VMRSALRALLAEQATTQRGHLVFDSSDDTLRAKVERAAVEYAAMHGGAPNLCHVHPHMAADGERVASVAVRINGRVHVVEVRWTSSMLPGHLWVGLAQSQTNERDVEPALFVEEGVL